MEPHVIAELRPSVCPYPRLCIALLQYGTSPSHKKSQRHRENTAAPQERRSVAPIRRCRAHLSGFGPENWLVEGLVCSLNRAVPLFSFAVMYFRLCIWSGHVLRSRIWSLSFFFRSFNRSVHIIMRTHNFGVTGVFLCCSLHGTPVGHPYRKRKKAVKANKNGGPLFGGTP